MAAQVAVALVLSPALAVFTFLLVVVSALALVGADALVRRMEQGLETLVGERGTLVSGGERQRLALARALLRKPRLSILDEATSAIDVSGERQVLQRLVRLKRSPTIIMIADRAESLSLCDRVIALKAHGEVRQPSLIKPTKWRAWRAKPSRFRLPLPRREPVL